MANIDIDSSDNDNGLGFLELFGSLGNTAIKGHFDKESSKNHMVAPLPTQQTFTPDVEIASQLRTSNIDVFGVPVNRTILSTAALAILGILIFKALR